VAALLWHFDLRMKAFLAGYPETAKAMQLIGNHPVSGNQLEARVGIA
jgi:hypothetical protein